MWDPIAKKRLRQLPKYPAPVSALAFNCDGTQLAVAYSEEDEGGMGAPGKAATAPGGGNGVAVRLCGDEVRPKAKA